MARINLFPKEQIVGVFRGFREGGLEFHADLVLPYRNDFQSMPMHGQFLLVQLETPEEAVLGRIASLSSEGKLTSSSGEEFNIRAMREQRVVPEDLREQYLRYRINMRVLGVLRSNGENGLTFVPSHRRLPHVGSAVAFPSPEVLRDVAGHNQAGAPLGHLAFGEYVYAQGAENFELSEWMQIVEPEVVVRFPVDDLVSRRTFVFARAGFGKSNLNKLLFSKLYDVTPTVTKRGDRKVPVGTVIFDRDGEYFWPDDKGRPGLCDVPALQDKLVVFTPREGPSAFYDSFVAGGVKLDLRQLRPADVIAIALAPERQEQQNVRKLRGLSQERWEALVNLVDRDGYQASLDRISDLLDLDKGQQQVEALAPRSNMAAIVRMLHDRHSGFVELLQAGLKEGRLCVVDVSQMRSGQALILSGLILRRLFDHNQQQFTAAEPATIPVIAVIEEAQAVLDGRESAAEPYLTWVKEGRKYDLGVVLVTQQPASIPREILSQGDNWFIFHLLSAGDLASLKQANAHFSDDLLSSLLNEPIPGHGVFWSSAGGKPYPTSVRVLSFERLTEVQDPGYDRASVPTRAACLKQDFEATREDAVKAAAALRCRVQGETAVAGDGSGGALGVAVSGLAVTNSNGPELDAEVDLQDAYAMIAVAAIRGNSEIVRRLQGEGVPWSELARAIGEKLPPSAPDGTVRSHRLVRRALDAMFGTERDGGWSTSAGRHGGQMVRAGSLARSHAD